MEAARSNKGIFVSQRKYTLELLKKTGMLGCKPSNTPMDPFNKIGSKEDMAAVDKGRYQRLVASTHIQEKIEEQREILQNREYVGNLPKTYFQINFSRPL